jgi:hypothetical protein
VAFTRCRRKAGVHTTTGARLGGILISCKLSASGWSRARPIAFKLRAEVADIVRRTGLMGLSGASSSEEKAVRRSPASGGEASLQDGRRAIPS